MTAMLENLKKVHELLNANGIEHVLIGAFAMSAYGSARATNDIDMMILGTKKGLLLDVMRKIRFDLFFESAEVVQFTGSCSFDFLLANRPLSMDMVKNPKGRIIHGVSTVSVEQIIGLKIQAYKNNPKRVLRDKADIQSLIENNRNLNWKLLQEYADMFGEFEELKKIRQTAESK